MWIWSGSKPLDHHGPRVRLRRAGTWDHQQALCRRSRRSWFGVLMAADEGIFRIIIQATNSFAVVSLLVDFKVGAEKGVNRQLLDRKSDGVRRLCKPPVPKRPPPKFAMAGGKQLCLGAVVKSGHGWTLPVTR